MATKSYAGAAWNQLMESETKESIAKMYLDSLDIRSDLLAALKRMHTAFNSKIPIPAKEGTALEAMCRAAITKAEGEQP